MGEFIKYGRFDTLEHAKNGLKGDDIDKLAEARLAGYKLHQKYREEMTYGKEKKRQKG